MDDGVQLSTAVQLPPGAQPAGGWPGVIVLHGLGANKATVAQISQYFVAHGYAALSYDARGHGASGGNVELAGPREVADLRTLFERFAALPEVSDTKIGCWGISYGGGQCWNGAAAGIPFGALDEPRGDPRARRAAFGTAEARVAQHARVHVPGTRRLRVRRDAGDAGVH